MNALDTTRLSSSYKLRYVSNMDISSFINDVDLTALVEPLSLFGFHKEVEFCVSCFAGLSSYFPFDVAA